MFNLVCKRYETEDPNKGYFDESSLVEVTEKWDFFKMQLFEDVLEARGYTFDCGPHTNMERHWFKKKGNLYKGWSFVMNTA